MNPGLTLAERVNVASRLLRMCGDVRRAMELVDALEAEALKRVPPPFVPVGTSPTDGPEWPGGRL